MKKLWKEWWKESVKAIPLVFVMILAFYKSFILGIIVTFLIFYIANLYDLKWQERKKKFRLK